MSQYEQFEDLTVEQLEETVAFPGRKAAWIDIERLADAFEHLDYVHQVYALEIGTRANPELFCPLIVVGLQSRYSPVNLAAARCVGMVHSNKLRACLLKDVRELVPVPLVTQLVANGEEVPAGHSTSILEMALKDLEGQLDRDGDR